MKRLYMAAAMCVLLFVLGQAFQEIAYAAWIPASHGPADDLRIALLPVDRVRALILMATILGLLVSFVAIALGRFAVAPVASVFGLLFGTLFVVFEISTRSIEFFVVDQLWAPAFQAAVSPPERDAILRNVTLWTDIVHGWYFPLLVSYLLASCAFAVSTWAPRRPWSWLAPAAFVLNALRLVGRLASTFGGQVWLDGFNDRWYFPAVLVINLLLLAWLVVEVRLQPRQG
jgi:hypothetical protein